MRLMESIKALTRTFVCQGRPIVQEKQVVAAPPEITPGAAGS